MTKGIFNMEQKELYDLLHNVKTGELSVEDAVTKIRLMPFEDIGYAKIDHHRAVRQGVGEVIYGAGKTPEQIEGIARSMQNRGQKTILITRLDEEKAGRLNLPGLRYEALPKLGLLGPLPEPDGIGTIVVATGGTSDIPVAEEAALTAEVLGNKVTRLYDVGVAGIHRLFACREEIMSAEVIIAIAGMEGALAGLSALLSMLNSCASGVSVVNIDNGFGAGYLAGMINHRRI